MNNNSENNVPMIEINGKLVPNFIQENNVEAAIVPLNTIKRLAQLLPISDLDNIKRELIEELRITNNLNDYIELLSDEINFHHTINLLVHYKPNKEQSRDLEELAKAVY